MRSINDPLIYKIFQFADSSDRTVVIINQLPESGTNVEQGNAWSFFTLMGEQMFQTS